MRVVDEQAVVAGNLYRFNSAFYMGDLQAVDDSPVGNIEKAYRAYCRQRVIYIKNAGNADVERERSRALGFEVNADKAAV